MELIEDKIIQKYAKHCGHCRRYTFFHTSMNLLA